MQCATHEQRNERVSNHVGKNINAFIVKCIVHFIAFLKVLLLDVLATSP